MELKTTGSLKFGGIYHGPGSVVNVEDKDEAARLLKIGACVFATPSDKPVEAPAPAPAAPAAPAAPPLPPPVSVEQTVEELTQVAGISIPVAREMYAAGIYGISELKKKTEEELLRIKGVKEATAKKIFADAVQFTFDEQE